MSRNTLNSGRSIAANRNHLWRLRHVLLAGAATALVTTGASAAIWNGRAPVDNNWNNDANWQQLNILGRAIGNASVVMNGGSTTAAAVNIYSAHLTLSGGASLIINGQMGGGSTTASKILAENTTYCLYNDICEPANTSLTITGNGTNVTVQGASGSVGVTATAGYSAILNLSDGAFIAANTVNVFAQGAGSRAIFNIGGAEGEGPKAAGSIQNAAGQPEATVALDNSVLVLNHNSNNYVFGAGISTPGQHLNGSGAVIRHLAGTTTFSGNSSDKAGSSRFMPLTGFADTTEVKGGTLLVTGKLGGTTIVDGSGTLGGTGEIGRAKRGLAASAVDTFFATTIGDGGTLAPGLAGSIGTLTVSGDLNFQNGSVYRVRIGDDGVSDRAAVGGNVNIENGSKVAVVYDNTLTYQSGWKYNILTYDGALNGRFDTIEDSILLRYALDYNEAGKVNLKISFPGEEGDDTGTDWFDTASWTDGIVPDATHEAVIDGDRSIVIDGGNAITQTLRMGTANGGGTLTIKNGGTLQAGGKHIFNTYYYTYIGDHADGPGKIIVTGEGSKLSFINPVTDAPMPGVYIGQSATSSLVISNGGAVTDAESIFFDNRGASDTSLIVTGENSHLTLSGTSSSGMVALKHATVSGGGKIDANGGSVIVGRTGGGDYSLLVTGATSSVVAKSFVVGRASQPVGTAVHGAATLSRGGTVTANNVDIGMGISSTNSAQTFATLNIGSAAGETAVAAGRINIVAHDDPATFSGITFGEGTGTLVFNHSNPDYELSADIRKQNVPGSATIRHLAGTTTYSGDGSKFVGNVEVEGGTFQVTDNLAGTFNVSGGTLAGTGTVGFDAAGTSPASVTTIASGGTLAAGLANEIGTLNVAGNLTFDAGSNYKVRIAENGVSDRVAVAGDVSINNNAKVAVVYDNNITYQDDWAYTILTYGGELSGGFAEVEDSILLSYDLDHKEAEKEVELSITVKEVPVDPVDPVNPVDPVDPVDPTARLAPFAITANELGTANALDSLGQRNALWLAVASTPNEAEARSAFNQLSGAQHASTKAAMVQNSHAIRSAINDRIRNAFGNVAAPELPVMAYGPDVRTPKDSPFVGNPPAVERATFWANAFGSWGKTDGGNGVGNIDRSAGGFLVGADTPVLDAWRLGVLGGYSRSSFDTWNSSGKSDSYHVGAYLGGQWDALLLRSGVSYAWNDVSSRRSVGFNTVLGSFNETLTAAYNARSLQAFGELGYRLDMGNAGFEPYANIAHVQLTTDAFKEAGGLAALSVARQTTNNTFSTLGLRVASTLDLGETSVVARGGIGWRYAFGDVSPTSVQSFTAGGDSFTVVGTPIARNVAVVEAGLDVKLSRNATAGISYNGQFGSSAQENSLNGLIKVGF